MNNCNELNQHRKSIAQIDKSILKLIKKRMDLSLAIGKIKHKNILKTEDLLQEQIIIKRNLQQSLQLNIDKNLTLELTKLLLKFSKSIQTKI